MTLSKEDNYTESIALSSKDGIANDASFTSHAVRPVLYIGNDIYITGEGTQDKPYEIIN